VAEFLDWGGCGRGGGFLPDCPLVEDYGLSFCHLEAKITKL
jgi:hypothetical protein